jgi:hypothetical protein
MTANRQRRYALRVGACAVILLAGCASAAVAQVGAFGGTGGPSLTPPPVVVRDDPFARPSRDYSALPVGDWLLYPTVFLGATYDSNVGQTSVNKTASGGGRLVPSLLAERTDGIHKTTLYGMADGRFYGNHDSVSTADTVSARAGLIQRYQPTADLVVNAQFDYTRQRDLFSTFGIDHSVTTLNPTAIGLSPVANPLAYNQFAGTASVQKTFDRAFVSFGGSIVDISYDTDPLLGAPSPNGTTYTGTGRGGFWFTPYLYAYLEGTVDQRRFADDHFNSNGYRTVGGIGTDQIGLFRGEVYGGYQSERHDFAPLGTVNGAVFGGRVYYYPTRELTISASVDESLGVSLLEMVPGALGTNTRATSALLQATYALAREWAASARFGYIRTDYVDTIRRDDAWTGGATVTYSVWQNFGLTLDYQHVALTSNVPFQGFLLTPTGFTRDVVTLGGTYKY